MRSFQFFIFLVFSIFIIAGTGCKKDKILKDSSVRLDFSTDTLTFDTVFTTLGSATRLLKLYNTEDQPIIVSDIVLDGGNQSNFRINVEGLVGDQEDMEIWANDSLYIFVEVTVDVNNQNTPLIILDSILFNVNGNRQKVVLMAWGQDAYYHFRDTISTNTTWAINKPHVICNFALVEEGATLDIPACTEVYFGGAAGLFVKGDLNVQGTKECPAIFRHIRLESFYDDLPGQWAGIFILRGSKNSVIRYAEIMNSDFGLSVGSTDARIDSAQNFFDAFTFDNRPVVRVENTLIKNSLANCISGFLSEINAFDCVMYNAGDYLASFSFGGIYRIEGCTFANYGSPEINHQTSTMLLSNGVELNDVPIPADLFAQIRNTVVYGSLTNEIAYGNFDGSLDSILFDHSLLRTEIDTPTTRFVNTLFNQDPLFTDRGMEDYTLQMGSPCIDAGTGVNIIDPEDFCENPVINTPDIGAYEFMP